MEFFTKQKIPSAPRLEPPNQGQTPGFPEGRVGCEVVHEGESPLKAEYVLPFYYLTMSITTSNLTSLVFVHGLGGHWYNTWSKNGVFWPRDLLSQDVQNVRIIVFGYDSSVVQFFGRVSRNQIRDHARTLIADLRRCRKKGDEVRSQENNNCEILFR